MALTLTAGVAHAESVDAAAVPRVGVLTDNEPFSFRGRGGEVEGFAVELLARIERRMGLRLERVVGSTREINAAFRAGRLDLLQSYAEAPARTDHADFSVPYLPMAGAIFVREGMTAIRSLHDLHGRKVMVHRGSLGESFLRAAGFGDALVLVDSVEQSLELLAAGRNDAVLATRLTGLAAIRRLGLRKIGPVGAAVPGYEVRYCFAVRKGESALLAQINEGLAILHHTGEFERIYRQWFGHLDPEPISPFTIALTAAVSLGIGLALAFRAWMRQRALAREVAAHAAALHASEERFRLTFEHAGIGMALVSDSDACLQANRALCQMLGYAEEDWEATTFAALTHPEDQARYRHESRRLLEGQVPFLQMENRYRHRDGRYLWGRLTATVVPAAAGRAAHMAAQIEDITAQKSAEAALRESQERLATIFNTVAEGIVVTDAQGIVLECNSAAERLLELDRAELVGHPVVRPEGRRRIREDGSTFPPDEWPVMVALRTGQPCRRQVVGLPRAGSSCQWILTNAEPVRDGAGNTSGVVASFSEITAQKEQEFLTSESEARFRHAFELANVGMAVSADNGAILRVNRALADFWGAPAADIVGCNGLEFEHPEDRIETREHIRQLDTGAIDCVRLERRYVRRDSMLVWGHLTLMVIRDHDRRPRYYIAQIEDITARKVAEAALHDSEARFSHAFEYASGCMGIVGLDWTLQRVNRHLAELLGYPAEEIVGRPLPEAIHPEDRQADVDQLRALFEGGPPACQLEVRLCRKTGETLWTRRTASLIRDRAGRPRHIVVQIEDITARRAAEEARRESEERFRLAFEQAGIGMGLLHFPEGRWLRVNRSLCEMLGQAEAELSHHTLFDFLHPDDRPAVETEAARLLGNSAVTVPMEMHLRHRSGRYLTARTSTSLVRDALGRPLYGIMQIEDITARRDLESELRAARDQALEASRHKSEFLAKVSHEIRTPMNAIIGTVEIFGTTQLDARQQEMSGVIHQSAASLLRIIDDILDISRIEAGKLRIGRTEFRPRQLVEETLALMRPLAAQKRLRLTHRIAPVLADAFLGDPVRVRQVLTNLVGNAIKFTPSGRVAVVVGTRAEESDAQKTVLRVSVRDTGLGIPAAIQPKLFQPFVQAGDDLRRQLGGTGLGLAISRHLVELMGGSMGFVSEDGAGSTFWFELPLSRALSLAPDPAVAEPATGEPLHLLVVEDNEANRYVARLQLEHLGHTVEAAEDGVAALEHLAKKRFDAVLMDCDMPRLDGLEATRRIRSGQLPGIDSRVHIIALTAFAMTEDRARCLAAGMDDHIAKPLTAEALRHALSRRHAAPALPAPPPAPTDVLDRRHLARLAAITTPDGRKLSETYAAMCLEEIPARLAEAEQLEHHGHAEALARLAHSLAGTAANLGANPLRAALKALEVQARTGPGVPPSAQLAAARQEWLRLQPVLFAEFPQFF